MSESLSNHLKISLVIPAYNEEKYIGQCLEHAIKNSGGKFFEIIVVDNASADSTGEIARQYSGVKVVREERKGTSSARERGLEESSGDIVAFIDADTRMSENWTNKALEFFSKHPEAVSLSGPYKYYDGFRLKNFLVRLSWWIFVPATYRLTGSVINGGNFVARRSALVAAGGFDKSITFYGDDTDVARRLCKLGKAAFRMNFFVYSSSRRFARQGSLKTLAVYAINFFWIIFARRPFTKTSEDIR